MKRLLCVWVILLLCVGVADGQTTTTLDVVSVSPEGELSSLAQANEVRVVFSEPMAALGRIPDRVTAPFFRITPAVAGTFRWAGTTVLVFTPDPKRPLAYATEYQVTIGAGATAVSGRRLAQAETFTFTTPTAKLLNTNWYRTGNTVNGTPILLLRFNQPMRPADVLAATRAALKPHDWTPPVFSPDEQARLTTVDPRALERFNAKVRATQATASSTAPVALRLATDWNKKQYPPSPDLVVLEVATRVEPESWLELTLAENLRAAGGRAEPGVPQQITIEFERAFFIDDFYCEYQCDGDGWNPVKMRSDVKVSDFAAALTVTDITAAPRAVAKRTAPRPRPDYDRDAGSMLTLEDAGYDPQPPNRKYAVAASEKLESADGQTLGYTWIGIVDNWHARAFSSFGDGHGVWEKDGGSLMPFYSRNIQTATQWAAPVSLRNLVPTMLQLEASNFTSASGDGVVRKLPVTPDRIQSHGLDVSKALSASGTGLVWTAIGEGDPIERSRPADTGRSRTRASLVQVTNLGISVKDSPQNTLVFVTRLDTGAPVSGASVSIVRLDNSIFWTGKSDANGVAIAPNTPLRDADDFWKLSFVVTAEKDGDVAYVGSNWNEGIQPWEFGFGANLNQATPLLRGSVFTDRGVYRLGEEIHFKAILRENTPTGVRLLAAGTPILITIRDSQYRIVEERTVTVNEWSSADWTMTLPQSGALGHYSLRAILERDRPKPVPAENRRPGFTPSPEREAYVPYEKTVNSSFLVAAYRRPDFRVDVTLSKDGAIAGDPLKGVVSARYLFGAPMGPRPVSWRFTASPAYGAPENITDRFTSDRWVFVGWPERQEREHNEEVAKAQATLTKTGDLSLDLNTRRNAGVPYIYTLEGDVEDVSRQHIANRATLLVHPAPWYIGVRQPPYFLQQRDGLKTEIVAVGLDAVAKPNVPVTVTLTQIQWNSVRRAEGNGFYTWESERREVPAGEWKVTTGTEPLPLQIPLPSGGYFILEARSQTEDGRSAITTTSFYALGDGYTAWARHDHNRIDLVAERQTYKPGDTARIMIQSPWEQATALLTTEREGIRTHRQFALTSTQQSVTVPITENDIPNLFVSVLLIKGRTQAPVTGQAAAAGEGDSSDPGKPAFRLGYVELKVEDAAKRLTVDVKANREEYRPASAANVRVNVKDPQGRPVRAEVALWAVDYGVISLTNYRPPDVASSVYVHKDLQVFNSDNRQRVISRRVLTPKGATEGGGGGGEGPSTRQDFRALAFWVGSVLTDANGDAAVDVKLPESLTTYRIMAVAADRNSRFGSDDTDVRTNKPLTLKPTFPRFLAVGDTAHFGAVVTSQLKTEGTALVTMKSVDASTLQLTGVTEQRVTIPPGGSVEVRFDGAAKAIGRARVQMAVKMGDETDAFEDVIPVEVLSSPETVAAYGEATDANAVATETLALPSGVVPGFGGLHVELASTALVGLGEGARYLVEYPYGCAEQKSSRTLALVLAADLGDAFALNGMNTQAMRASAQATLRELETFQCPSGGFAYWPGQCVSTSPYLTAYILHIFKVASDLKYDVNAGVRERALTYLERELAKGPPANEGWWPAYTAWKAFATKVVVEAGRNQDSTITRLYGYRDRMPVFALAYLHDALMAKGETSGDRVADLRRRMSNAILQEAGSAHVEELSDPYLLWFWNSNVRSTAIVLNSLAKANATTAPMRQLVRWMMAVRKDGRWGNTQENAHAMEALVNYYRKYESTTPNFTAIASLGQQELARERFEGRSTESRVKELPIAAVTAPTGGAGAKRSITFTREGQGTLFYTARLRYASNALFQEGLNAGFRIERRYEPYVEGAASNAPVATSYKAGDLVRVTLTLRLTKERRFVAVTDPLPAGLEPVESWFQTTAGQLSAESNRQSTREDGQPNDDDWTQLWRSGGFDHVERHDDRVQLFATRLSEGVHVFSYVARATTAGTFRTAPAHAEEMYEPEVFGRTATDVIEVKR